MLCSRTMPNEQGLSEVDVDCGMLALRELDALCNGCQASLPSCAFSAVITAPT